MKLCLLARKRDENDFPGLNAARIRARAEQTRQLAKTMVTPGIAKTLEEVARGYDEMAAELEKDEHRAVPSTGPATED